MQTFKSFLSEAHTKHLVHVWQYGQTYGKDRMDGWIRHSRESSPEAALAKARKLVKARGTTYAVGHDEHPVLYHDGAPISAFKE